MNRILLRCIKQGDKTLKTLQFFQIIKKPSVLKLYKFLKLFKFIRQQRVI